MSHFTTIKTQIRDIDALRAACEEMSFTLLKDGIARGYAQQTIRADYVIRLNGLYDIALHQQPDRSFSLTADIDMPDIEQEVGKGYGKLLQFYGVHKAMQEAKRKGHFVKRKQQNNGSIKLIIATA